jgi:hypothetical protein
MAVKLALLALETTNSSRNTNRAVESGGRSSSSEVYLSTMRHQKAIHSRRVFSSASDKLLTLHASVRQRTFDDVTVVCDDVGSRILSYFSHHDCCRTDGMRITVDVDVMRRTRANAAVLFRSY